MCRSDILAKDEYDNGGDVDSLSGTLMCINLVSTKFSDFIIFDFFH